MNYALAILIFVLLVLVILFIAIMIRVYLLVGTYVPDMIIVPNADTSCKPDINKLVDVSNAPFCTNQSQFLIGSKYVASLNMIVGLIPKPFVVACSSACISGFDASKNQCTDPKYQPDFEKCIDLTIPTGCTSISNPVGREGPNYYYINYYGVGSCFES